MNEKIEYLTTTPFKSKLTDALKNRRIVYLKHLGWVYLTEWVNLTNPQTGVSIVPPSTSKVTFISEGQNGTCKGNHKEFLINQDLQIQEMEIPEIESNQEAEKIYSVKDTENNLLLTYSSMQQNSQVQTYIKVSRFKLAKELMQEIGALPAYIMEEYDWSDLQTPEDSDNPRPRILKLSLI